MTQLRLFAGVHASDGELDPEPELEPDPDAWIDKLQALLREWAACGTLDRVLERRQLQPSGKTT